MPSGKCTCLLSSGPVVNIYASVELNDNFVNGWVSAIPQVDYCVLKWNEVVFLKS